MSENHSTNGNGAPLRAGGYCRTSGEGQRDNTSIPNQKRAIEAFCQRQGWQLVRIYVDECKSGANVEGRDEFKRMLTDAANGQLDIIVPFDATRFARDGVDVVSTAKFLKATYGIPTVDSKGQFDNRDHRNALRNFVQAGVSEHERLTIMERMLGARVDRARAGLPWCGHPPFGRTYRKSCDCRKKCRCPGQWQVDDRGRAMAALLEEYLAGGSLKDMAPRYGFYSASHVQRLIHEGQLAARPYVVTFDTPEIGIKESVPVPAVPPVISLDLERRVLDRLLHNRNWNKQALRKYILGGFLRCAYCNAALVARPRKNVVYYDHHRDTRGGGKGCAFKRVPGQVVEGPVLDYLYRWLVDQPAFDLAVKLALPDSGERDSKQALAASVATELAQVERDVNRLVDAILKGADPGLLVSRQAELKARKEALTARGKVLQGELAGMPDPDAVRAEADVIRVRLARQQVGKDWRQEAFDDVRRFLHFLFGDNPRKEGLGIYMYRSGGDWSAEIRARLRLRLPVARVLGTGDRPLVGATDGNVDDDFSFWAYTQLEGRFRGEFPPDLAQPSADNSLSPEGIPLKAQLVLAG